MPGWTDLLQPENEWLPRGAHPCRVLFGWKRSRLLTAELTAAACRPKRLSSDVLPIVEECPPDGQFLPSAPINDALGRQPHAGPALHRTQQA